MNLVVYGSLINKDELLKENIALVDVEVVKVIGFRRVFTQEPSYRFVDSINRAVLNVIEDKDYWFNAIIIKNLNEEYFSILDKREKGYNRTLVDKSLIKNIYNEDIDNCYIYLGKKEKQNNKILPNQDYLDICLNGVKSFGKEFYDDFKMTTYKNSETGLSLI